MSIKKICSTPRCTLDFDLDTYLFETNKNDLSYKERGRIEALVKREIEELFHGRNLD